MQGPPITNSFALCPRYSSVRKGDFDGEGQEKMPSCPLQVLVFLCIKKIIFLKNNKNPTSHKLSVEWMDVGKGYVQGNGHKKIHISNQPSCVQLLPNAHG